MTSEMMVSAAFDVCLGQKEVKINTVPPHKNQRRQEG
jgi:hypothetical protein